MNEIAVLESSRAAGTDAATPAATWTVPAVTSCSASADPRSTYAGTSDVTAHRRLRRQSVRNQYTSRT